MVCALTFLNGHVHFKSKFVSTKHREKEKEHQQFLYMGQMGTRKKSLIKDTLSAMKGVITGTQPKMEYRNPSNTNVIYWGGKVIQFRFQSEKFLVNAILSNSVSKSDCDSLTCLCHIKFMCSLTQLMCFHHL